MGPVKEWTLRHSGAGKWFPPWPPWVHGVIMASRAGLPRPPQEPGGAKPMAGTGGVPTTKACMPPGDWTDSDAESFRAHRPRGPGPPGQSGEDWVQAFPPRHSRDHFCSALGAEPLCSETRPGTENVGPGHEKKGRMPDLIPPSPAQDPSGTKPILLV